MCKVVKAVILIAVSVAIIVYAPQLASGILKALGTATATALATTATIAATTAVLSIAASLAMNAIFGGASSLAPTTGTALSTLPATRAELQTFGQISGFDDSDLEPTFEPVRDHWLRDVHFLPGQRFCTMAFEGSCMRPSIPDERSWCVISRDAPITRGDFFCCNVTDLAEYCAQSGLKPGGGLGKRFLGYDRAADELVFECTFPPTRIRTPLARVLWAHKVVSIHKTRWQARRAALLLWLKGTTR